MLIALATAAVAAGADSFIAIGAWAADLPQYLLEGYGAVRGAPSETTFRRVLQRLDPGLLDPVLAAWAATRAPSTRPGRRFIALDGKTLRGSTTQEAAVALVAAVEHDTGAVLGQVRVCAGDEIGAVTPLLDTLDLTDAVITADALHTQRAHAHYLHRHRAYYLFTVKTNHPKLYQQLSSLPWAAIPRDVITTEKSHGRIETRTLQATTVQAGIEFPHAKLALRVERTRRPVSSRSTPPATTSTQVVYAITDLRYDQVNTLELAAGLRNHWAIENRLHHVRDVTFDEDHSQVRTGHAAHVMATLRNTVITLLRHQGADNIAAARRALAAHPDRALALLT